MSTYNTSILKILRQRWWFLMITCVVMITSGLVLLWQIYQSDAALRWVFFPILISSYILTVLLLNLSANHRQGEQQLLSSLGWGNLLTFTRALLIAALSGFLLLPLPGGLLIWVPGLLFVFVDAADFFDGYIARITDHSTRLGEILDMSIDGLGVLVASLLALKYGQVPFWYVAVAFARPLFLAGIWIRRRLNLPVYDLPPSRSRRLFAGLQLGFLAVVLMPVFSPPVTNLGALIFGLPLLLGFVRDWLAVSGKLQVGALSSRTRFLADGLPLTLRLAALVLNLALAVHWSASIERPDSLLAFMFLANFVLGSLVILGVMPRIASIFALVVVGFILMITSLTPQLVMLAVDYSILLYIGSGSLSLWPIDDRLFRTPVGGKPIIQPSAAPHQPAADKMRPDTAPQPVLDRFKESFPSLEGST